jgi:hypothetical protein
LAKFNWNGNSLRKKLSFTQLMMQSRRKDEPSRPPEEMNHGAGRDEGALLVLGEKRQDLSGRAGY